jgi:hypothetical protein
MIRRIASAAFASLALAAAFTPVAAANEAEQETGRSQRAHAFHGVGTGNGYHTIRPRDEDDRTIRP